MTNHLVAVKDAARELRQLGVSVNWLKGEIKAGRLPALQVNKRTWVDVNAVRAAMLARAAGSVPTAVA